MNRHVDQRLQHGRRRILGLCSALLGWLVLGGLSRANPRSGKQNETVEVDLSSIPPGGIVRVQWRGKPVFVRHRTLKEIQQARSVAVEQLPDPAADKTRVKRPEWLVVVGVCTHGGCIPTGPMGNFGGWYCLCHGSQFDTSGRVRVGPARDNLEIPPYRFLSEHRLRIGEQR